MLRDDDEQRVKSKLGRDYPVRDLSSYSVDVLDDYIQELETEITRAKAEKSQKAASLTAAHNFFKSKGD